MGDIESAEMNQGNALLTVPVGLSFPNPPMSQEVTPVSRNVSTKPPYKIELPPHLEGEVTNEFYEYMDLRRAISKGDLEAVKSFLSRRPDAICAWIDHFETPLHKACSLGQVEIVKELLLRMTPEQVLTMERGKEYPNDTALCVAARTGNMEIAKALIAKNQNLLEIPGYGGGIPVSYAVYYEHEEVAHFLYDVTPRHVLLDDEGYQGCNLLTLSIYAGMLDIAVDIFKACPRLGVTKHPRLEIPPLAALAEMPELFPSSYQLRFWSRLVYSWIQVKRTAAAETWSSNQCESLSSKALHCFSKWFGIDDVFELKEMHTKAHILVEGMCKEIATMGEEERSENEIRECFHCAVTGGNKEFMVEMIRSNPEFLRYVKPDSGRGIFHLAIETREERIFELIYGVMEMKSLLSETDDKRNGLLHVAGNLSPRGKLSQVAGAALQMLRELQWFKEVESVVPEMDQHAINDDSQTPIEIFEEKHEPLRREAEKWMKGTATACSVVAALIATVTFDVVFNVPGGTDEKSGDPHRLEETRFTVFIIADIVSFFASCTSVLIFLGILTARYSFDDFLKSLPSWMIAGLSTLFLSVAAMLVAFSTALFTTLQKTPRLVIPVLPLASLPAALFVMMQYPLLKEMISSTYGKGIFNRDTKPWF